MATLKEALIGTEEQNKQGQANLDKAAQSGSEIAKFLGGKEKPATPKPEEPKPEVKKAKGGKVMKKTKKFDDGGRIGEDVRERAMRSVANLTDEGDVATVTRNEYGDITPTLSSMEKSAAQKTRAEPAAKASKSENDDNSPLPIMAKKSSVDELKNMVLPRTPRSFQDSGGSSKMKVFSANLDELKQKNIPRSFKGSGGSDSAKVSNTNLNQFKNELSIPKPRLYDPLSGFDKKGMRLKGRETDDRKKGGSIKMAKGGSASSRADGCAIRGKTRA